jgi:hypothetical protein
MKMMIGNSGAEVVCLDALYVISQVGRAGQFGVEKASV